MTIVFTANIRLPNGRTVGTVQVRDHDVVSGRGFDGRPVTVPELAALDFRSSSAPRAHWLQFLWKEEIIDTSRGIVHSDLTVGNHDGHQIRFTENPSSNRTRRWTVDWVHNPANPNGAPRPWYDYGGLVNTENRNSQLTMFDAPISDSPEAVGAIVDQDIRTLRNRPARPRRPSISPQARVRSVELRSHFDSYLVLSNPSNLSVVYHVQWNTIRSVTNPLADPSYPARQVSEPVHTFGRHGPVRRLPDHLLSVIHREFPEWEYLLRRSR
jgi:hypothetical protein